MQADTIDFLRGGTGKWILWVVFPLLMLMRLKWERIAGWRAKMRAVAIRLLLGLLIVALIHGLGLIWVYWGPQYFIKLRTESDRVVLGFHWPKPEFAIPFGELKNIQVVQAGTRRHPCSRVQIRTAALTYQSWGFGKFNEEEMAIMDRLRTKVGPSVTAPKQ